MLAIALTAGVLHVAIVRLRVPSPVLWVGAALPLLAVSVFVPATSAWASVAGAVVAVLALATAAARRQVRRTIDGMLSARPDPVAIPADGLELVRRLELEGFQVADDGWVRSEALGSVRSDALGWCLVALRRGPTRVFVVSGERGPAFELSTTFDNGRTLLTAASGRDRVAPDVVRQVFRTDDPIELLSWHDDVVTAASAAGRTPLVPAVERLTADALVDEVAHGRQVLAGGVPTILVGMVRELTGADADVGPVTERPDDWLRLVARPG